MVQELLSQIDLWGEFTQFLLLLCFGVAVITVIIAIFFKSQRWAKFVPGLMLLIWALVVFLGISSDFLANHNLEKLTLIVVLGVLGVVSVCVAMIAGLVIPKRKKRRRSTAR